MSAHDDGGPAFPILPSEHKNFVAEGFDGVTRWTMGMSLRDYFAGQALAGMSHHIDHMLAEQVASDAYRIADAMLIAREAA